MPGPQTNALALELQGTLSGGFGLRDFDFRVSEDSSNQEGGQKSLSQRLVGGQRIRELHNCGAAGFAVAFRQVSISHDSVQFGGSTVHAPVGERNFVAFHLV